MINTSFSFANAGGQVLKYTTYGIWNTCGRHYKHGTYGTQRNFLIKDLRILVLKDY